MPKIAQIGQISSLSQGQTLAASRPWVVGWGMSSLDFFFEGVILASVVLKASARCIVVNVMGSRRLKEK